VSYAFIIFAAAYLSIIMHMIILENTTNRFFELTTTSQCESRPHPQPAYELSFGLESHKRGKGYAEFVPAPDCRPIIRSCPLKYIP